MYGRTDPAFEIAYRSTTDGGVHLLTVRARNLQDARGTLAEVKAEPGEETS